MIIDSIFSILMIIAGGIICGLPKSDSGYSSIPIAIVLIILGFLTILVQVVDSMIDKIIESHNKETNIIINLPKRNSTNENEQQEDVLKNWESLTDEMMESIVKEQTGK